MPRNGNLSGAFDFKYWQARGLSVRAVNVLKNVGLSTAADVVDYGFKELSRYPQAGKVTIAEIFRAVMGGEFQGTVHKSCAESLAFFTEEQLLNELLRRTRNREHAA